MEIDIKRKSGVITVTASMIPRISLERRLRFYVEDAIEAVKKKFPNIGDLVADENSNGVTISNYREPHSGEWIFYIQDESHEMFKAMADEFEEKHLNSNDVSAKINKRKVKPKENE
jgi:hypothetical protein